MATDFRKLGFVYRSCRSDPLLVERSTKTFRGYQESYPPIMVAEIPRPLWQQPLIDWDDDDPPPLPPRFDDDVAPLISSRRPLFIAITAALIGTVVIGASLAWLSALPGTIQNEIANAQGERTGSASAAQTAETDVGSRIDIAIAALREDTNAVEEKKALIRSARPKPMLDEPPAPAAPAALLSTSEAPSSPP